MKKLLFSLCLALAAVAVNAQGTGFSKPEEQPTQRRALFQPKAKKPKGPVDAKYLEGACPEVNGKIQWETTIAVEGMTAKQMYDKMLAFLQAFCKEENMTNVSNVSVVNEGERLIGVRIQEWLVFENKPLSLDRTKFNYQLIVSCADGKCNVVMRNLSYIYEEERGGGMFPAEDMISDSQALNKKKDGFQKGGVKKFRTKTIDRKDEVFARIASLLNEK